jgi:aminoglycoside phosphotransferase (APT) family kinase protein
VSARWEALVPETLHDAVRAALDAAYGAAPMKFLGQVTGGASGAVALRIGSGSHRHLLRVEAWRNPLRNPHQYECMKIAAAAGVAPPLHYVDPENGVALMDFIEAVPLDRFPGGGAALAEALGEFARSLQETPAFPALGDWRAIVGRLLSLLESRSATGLLEPHRAAYERLCEALAWDDATHVSSHNDPNARNVLFDGARLWLIDWETAYRNDPMVDVAILADNLAPTPELTGVLTRAWLGRAPLADEVERLEAVRRLTRLYYAGLLIGFGGPPDLRIADLSAPSRAEAEAQVARGELTEVTPESLVIAGKMCLAAFLEPLP